MDAPYNTDVKLEKVILESSKAKVIITLYFKSVRKLFSTPKKDVQFGWRQIEDAQNISRDVMTTENKMVVSSKEFNASIIRTRACEKVFTNDNHGF